MTIEEIEERKRQLAAESAIVSRDDLYEDTEIDTSMAPDSASFSAADRSALTAASKSGGTAGDVASLASMYAVNPYVGGAATGLMALDKVAAARQKDREAKAAAANARIGAIQQQIGSMTQAAQGLSI